MIREQRREEAKLEALCLRAVGKTPDLLLMKNEVGQGYPCAELRALLEAELKDQPGAAAVVRQVLARARRVTYGLGPGSPDNFGALAGRALGIEYKTPDGDFEPGQREWHAAARARGVAIMVVRSVPEMHAAIERARRGELE